MTTYTCIFNDIQKLKMVIFYVCFYIGLFDKPLYCPNSKKKKKKTLMNQRLSLKSKAKPFKSFSATQTITIKLIPTFYMMQGLKNIKSPWPP